MRNLLAGLMLIGNMLTSSMVSAQDGKPTIVLVHGAFADGSSWNGVAKVLRDHGYRVVATANPLRSVGSDAEYVSDIISGIKTPVVLVGHSYGGSVISQAANGNSNVKALVYVDAFAPETGETVLGLSGKFPGSTLGPALDVPVALTSGGNDLYIRQDKYHDQFAADVADSEAKLMAITQRPITETALNEASTDPAWKKLPSWFVYGDKDKNIPPQTLEFMAKRANSRETVVISGASHVAMVSNPEVVAELIERAAEAK